MPADKIPYLELARLHNPIHLNSSETAIERIAARELWQQTLEMSGWTEDEFDDATIVYAQELGILKPGKVQ